MTSITIGALRHSVELQAPVETAEAGGAATTTWQTVATVWASVVPASGREVVAGDGLVARTIFDVTIRYRDDVGADHRFIHDGRTLHVHAAFDPDGKRRWLVCRCEHRTP